MKNKVRIMRLKLGISQTKLAAQVGIAQGQLSNVELGKLRAWPKMRRDIARALGVSETELFPN